MQDACGLGGSSTWSGSFFGSKGTTYFTRQVGVTPDQGDPQSAETREGEESVRGDSSR